MAAGQFNGYIEVTENTTERRYFRIPHTGSLTFSGILNIILAVVFLLLPFVSALALNYILAAYLIIVGAALLIEAAGMHKISM